MKRTISGLLVVLVIVSMLSFTSGASQVRALDPPIGEPSTQILDFNNGTKEMIIDFHNGTRNCISETYIKKTAELTATNETSQASISIPTGYATTTENACLSHANAVSTALSTEESVKYASTTQTMVMKQQMMLGFTYTLAYWQEEWKQEGGWWIFKWYLAVGIDIDIRFGLRLPINVTLEYPERMTAGNNYTIHATLDPVDKPDFPELLLTCKANIWAQAGLAGINIPRTVLWGPNIDGSQSFATPLGSSSAPLLPKLRIPIFDLIKIAFPSLKDILDVISKVVVPYLDVQPTFGSNLVNATASAIGDARVIAGKTLNWSEPHQTQDFTVDADEYDPITNYSRLILTDFRYYFTNFTLNFDLELDFAYLINTFLNFVDPIIHIYTLDMTWINTYIGIQHVNSHSGYPGSIYVQIYVDRILNPSPPTPLEDVAIAYAYAIPPKVCVGDIVNITVGVKNLGNISENFKVTIYADNTILNVTSVAGLSAGGENRIDFEWNTTGFAPWCVYNITAEASIVPNEFDKENNVLSAGAVEIVLPSPWANFTYSPVPPILNQTTMFNASSSISGSGSIVSYVWDFGEGKNATTANPIATYVFGYDGNHKVTLTVINSDGLKNTLSEVINVLKHDVAVTSVVPYRKWVYQGSQIKINVSVTNEGNFTESTTVKLYYNVTAGEEIETTFFDLAPGENKILTFNWNTTGVAYCHNYTITAVAEIQFDSNVVNNMMNGTMRIKVRIPSDVNGDGKVDLKDVYVVSQSFGENPDRPKWNPDADLNGDGKIDLKDFFIIATKYGKNCV